MALLNLNLFIYFSFETFLKLLIWELSEMNLNEQEIIIASNNESKIAEIYDILKVLNVKLLKAKDVNAPEVEESENTFEGNAKLKALTIATAFKKIAIADDSGLCVHCLENRLGVYTARAYDSKTLGYEQAFQRLNIEMGESADRTAHFECCIVIAWPSGEWKSFTGKVQGHIAKVPAGKTDRKSVV